jgi:4-hydroxy 2-oxovalerate aldolase
MSLLTDFKILDCTIRDGGYLNNWKYDKKLIKEVYRSLSKCGVDYVEIGFRGTEKHFDKNKYGISRFSKEEDIQEAVANINGAKLALMADYGKIESDDFCESNNSMVDLVRMAVHKDNLKSAIKLLEQIKNKGYLVSLNAMGYTNYSESERKKLVDLLKAAELDYIYVADSYGSIFPNQIMQIFEPLLCIENINVGFHSHNNLQMAFANTIEAIRCGVHMIDCTIYGMGRAAGNLPTEIIIAFLEIENGDKYNSIPVLNIIDRYFVSLQKEYTWGYQLPYMLSGMFECHPNYAKELVDLREYTIEDIWKAMDYIKKRDSVGFSKELLNELIGDGVIGGMENVLRKESSLSTTSGKLQKMQESNLLNISVDSVKEHTPKVSYFNRYLNRDILVIANGPSLQEYKPQIDEFINSYNPITIGANYLGGLFKPHYHAFNNKRRFIKYIDSVNPESKLILGQYMPDKLVREYTDRDYEKIYYTDMLNYDFGINNGVITTNCRTISVLLLGLAIVMGARRVFCTGMDGYKNKDSMRDLHFYNEEEEKTDRELIVEIHRWCGMFIGQIDRYLSDKGQEGVHILTPTSYKSFYKGFENYI